ncbi:hypothetical protein PV10_06388 [Exophiala mesophila]|uniref:Nuclear pore complex protein An-Nup82 n=1 Tax=Exophiala mesophila TaxID=212818 RepID=A0A0D1ZYE7_EXOME|nr:uncharacterized protein PV10_06388 [Exophiala mesophila]KIV91898.1 hypothetical protein PV10_06388 [Exophiala mesophila]
MPKVIGYTPPWLSRPSPGARIFTDPAPQSPASPSKRSSYLGSPPSTDYQGPRRLLASRGTEVFTVVGNKIRWADLTTVRDNWEDTANSRSGSAISPTVKQSEQAQSYRLLDVSIYYQIRHIAVSPSGSFLAISTEHTVHLAVLPASSRLSESDRSPLKLKTYQLGPTIHVIPESPLASVLWHPLASSTPSTDCLVTITAEAAVRVWEIDRSNKWSFETPALAIDLRKLADGVSCDDDFSPSGFGKSRGFSVDDFDMDISSAVFGGRGREDEDAWASMTLWVATRNGDLYALCPLLPSTWRPTETTIPSLSTSAVAQVASLDPQDLNSDERRAANQQLEWVQEIDSESLLIVESPDSLSPHEACHRPHNPSAIPRLQGPFSVQPADDDDNDIDISDIFVFPAKLDEQEFWAGEEDYVDYDRPLSSGVPFTTIAIATTQSHVWLAIDLDGVSGQWLPKKGRSVFSLPSTEPRELTLIDNFQITKDSTTSPSWPTFTVDVVHNYCLFAATTNQIHSISLNDWVNRLAGELNGNEPIDPGFKTRIETTAQGQVAYTASILNVDPQPSQHLSAPTIIDDTGLGYFLLSSTPTSAHAVSFDQDHLRAFSTGPPSPELTTSSPFRLTGRLSRGPSDLPPTSEIENIPSRSPYAPAHIFYANQFQHLENLRQRLPQNLKRAIVESPMRLSPAILEIMTASHRMFSVQSAELEKAASELFRKCQRLQEELGDQVKQMTDLAQRLQNLQSSEEEDEQGHPKPRKTHEERIQEAKDRQKALVSRYEELRRKVGRATSTNRELTVKEKAWIEEVNTLGRTVGIDDVDGDEGLQEARVTNASSLGVRFDTVKQLATDLSSEARVLQEQEQQQASGLDQSTSSLSASATFSRSRASIGPGSFADNMTGSGLGVQVSNRLQKEKIAEVMSMVERESAVIDAVAQRLERLRSF